jgi:hypothetical protein
VGTLKARIRHLPWPPGARGLWSGAYASKVILAGVFAGTLATLVQMLSWAAAELDLWAMLLRDARLAAALVLGETALSPRSSFEGEVILAATVVHFYLSVFYAAIALPLATRWSVAPTLLAGICYGALIYFANLHVLTSLFPWFIEARGEATLAAHLVFGATVMLSLHRSRLRD